MISKQLVTPPNGQRVAQRALVLSAVVCRSFSDHDPFNPDAQDLWERLTDWVDSVGVDSEMEPRERDLIHAPLGSLAENDVLTGTWRTEALAVLAWSLGLFDLPRHDEQVDPFELTDAMYLLSPDAEEIVQSASLLPKAELSAYRELLYAIHCRLRQFAREPAAKDIRDWIEPEWLETLQMESVLAADGDLSMGGVSLSEADEDAWQASESITCERHRAIVWLTGEEGPVYSEVPVDT